MSADLDYISRVRGVISQTAQRMLDGEVSYIEGSRRICDLLEPARIDCFEEPFVAFVAVAGETDAVPIGEVRDRWHPDAKIKFALEWENAETYAKYSGEAACKDAIAWLVGHPFKRP